MPDLDLSAGCRYLGHACAWRAGTTHLRELHQDPDNARRRADPAHPREEYETKLESLQELISGSKSMSFDNLQAASSTSLPITRGVIEALRDEPDQDILARRLASEVALASVLEKHCCFSARC